MSATISRIEHDDSKISELVGGRTFDNVQDAVSYLQNLGFYITHTRNGWGRIQMAYQNRKNVNDFSFELYGNLPDVIVEIIP